MPRTKAVPALDILKNSDSVVRLDQCMIDNSAGCKTPPFVINRGFSQGGMLYVAEQFVIPAKTTERTPADLN